MSEPQRLCDECDIMVQAGDQDNLKRTVKPASTSAPAASSSSPAPAPEEPKPEPVAAKPKKQKNCVCGMPLCICPEPEEEPEEERKEEPTEAPKAKKVSTASSNYSESTVSSFSGFGTKQKRTYDLSGNLNEQCREAVKAGDLEGVNELLKAGASAKYEDRTGNTLLHLAAMFNRLDLVEALVKAGGDLSRKNPDKETPADLAPPSLQAKIKAMEASSKS